mgnify:CR=1 FL=1
MPPHTESVSFSVEEVLLRLGIALVLVLANGFFVAAEFSLVGSRTTRIQEMASSGRPGARMARGSSISGREANLSVHSAT